MKAATPAGGPRRASMLRQQLPATLKPVPPSLFDGGLDRREGRVQAGAEASDHGDDRHRDPGGDEPVFDGGRARLITKETHECRHPLTPHSCSMAFNVLRCAPLLPARLLRKWCRKIFKLSGLNLHFRESRNAAPKNEKAPASTGARSFPSRPNAYLSAV